MFTRRKRGVIFLRKKIVFITATRADYGKLKSILIEIEKNKNFDCYVYITGMHMLDKYGATYKEVLQSDFENVYMIENQDDSGQNMADITASTMENFTAYINEINPNLIVVHGDRLEALAAAIAGAFNNIMVAHIEGGEVTGTIDESIRHAITKFSHIHLVANDDAKMRVIQLGERAESVFVIGSPDIDIMLQENLRPLAEVKKYYEIDFIEYGILMFHPVTTEYQQTKRDVDAVIAAVKQSNKNYIVIYPNNDLGSDIIIEAYKEQLLGDPRFRIFPSIKFESFLVLMKNSSFVIGNSSAGIREASYYNIPAIDIGTRQEGRYDEKKSPNIFHVKAETAMILEQVDLIQAYKNCVQNPQMPTFGDGKSKELFIELLEREDFWQIPIQKKFIDFH
jgi:UDP-N-acetyl-D-glucosamine 2-epimerase, UDP-hydrolysing